jgi:hypothetical protein
MYHPFSVTETIRNAWGITKKNFAVIIVYTLIAIVIFMGFGFVVKFILIDPVLDVVAAIVSTVGLSLIFLGFIKLVFRLIDKEYYDFDFIDIVPKFKMLYSYVILLVIVSTLAVFVSNTIKQMDDSMIKYLLGIFSGLFVEIFFLFYFPLCACFIVDDDSGPFESVAQSFHLIKGNFWKYFILFLFIEALVLVGSFTVIGLIFVVPFVNILLVVAYRKLIYSHQDVDDDVSETI